MKIYTYNNIQCTLVKGIQGCLGCIFYNGNKIDCKISLKDNPACIHTDLDMIFKRVRKGKIIK